MSKSTTKSNQNLDKKQSPTTLIGNEGEKQAKAFLLKQGLKFICQQYRTRCGEIDLIMKDNDEIVFVEVRTLQSTALMEPHETINHAKKKRLIHSALLYLQSHDWTDHFDSRFDVVGISGDQLNSKITWITNAFGVE